MRVVCGSSCPRDSDSIARGMPAWYRCIALDLRNKSKLWDLFRRTWATGLYQDGVPIEMVSVILGHSNTETTKIYAAPSVEQLRENVQRAQSEDTSVEKLWEGKEDEVRKIFGLA